MGLDKDKIESSETAVLGKWWQEEQGAFRCHLCPRKCLIRPGKRGFCYVRAAGDDGIYLTTYGRSSGFCIDPIEKKPLNHFLPGTPVLTFGTAGCNLGCRFCQNWDISKARDWDKLSSAASPEQIAAAAVKLKCRSVAFSYNDPVIFAEYAIDTARACRDQGIKAVAVSAGYISEEAREEFYSAMDAANIDLKGFREEFYRDVALGHLQPVLDTLMYLVKETKVWTEITTLLIPGVNDSDQEIADACAWIADHLGADVPLHFTAFHPDYKMLDKPSTPAVTLTRARKIGLDHGLRYIYTGNIHDPAGSSTYCPSCGDILIERDWYVLKRRGLVGNACGKCGAVIPGLFEDALGDWGAKRVPVSF